MNPEFVAQLTAAVVLAIGVWTAIGATRHPNSRIQMIAGLVGALAILLVVRLIAPFGGWGDWFVWVWLSACAVCVAAAYRAAWAWPDLPSRGAAPRAETVRLATWSAILLLVTGALTVPGLLLG